mmetsp:Transcript_25332/g.35511  ORF Transcript_25332/g.35511 Transcript_25332/m.35511 type:complete len:534 (-) Transcript_25332:49-1650(-)
MPHEHTSTLAFAVPSNGHTNGHNTEVNKIRGYSEQEFLRVIIQALDELGYCKSKDTLEKESGITLQSPSISSFTTGVLEGNWGMVEEHIADLETKDKDMESAKKAKFLVFRQKYLELVEGRKTKEALDCLRHQIAPLKVFQDQVGLLSSYLMCTSAEDLKRKANWDGALGNSRKKLLDDLHEYISPSQLLPAHRLQTLVSQAIQYQQEKCLMHNIGSQTISLYQDHQCDRFQLPITPRYVLEKHSDEIWHVKFSHNGKYLASASKDSTVMIWTIDGQKEPALYCVLSGHTNAVSFISWSPDDKHLLSCASDNLIKLWDVERGCCLRTITKHTESVTSCAWFPDGKHFVSGSIDKYIYMFDIDGNEIRQWSTARINDLTVTSDGKTLIAICQEKKIRFFDLESRTEEHVQETESITSMELSDDSKYLLINVASHELHIWDVESKKLVQKFRGHKQSRYVIRSCFGGHNQSFVASGSEDSNIFIWNRQHSTLLEKLSGHSGTVNSVAWNPVDPFMLASASDDHTIRIWTSSKQSC